MDGNSLMGALVRDDVGAAEMANLPNFRAVSPRRPVVTTGGVLSSLAAHTPRRPPSPRRFS
jgi:hypothetical protein